MIKIASSGCLLILGLCAAIYLPSLFAGEREPAQRTSPHVDSEPQQLFISCEITVTDADGKSEIVASPSVITLNGQAATVEVTQDNGESLKVQLIGQIIQPEG